MEINRKSPLVSICIPVYNNSNFLKQTLESILKQTYENIEIIIGDNASTENILDVINMFNSKKIKYYKNETNLGYAGNCNKLIREATGKYISIYHSDDVYMPRIVEEEVKFLEENENIGAVFTWENTINSNNVNVINVKNMIKRFLFVFYINKFNIKSNLILEKESYINSICKFGNRLICPSSMIRKDVYLDLNGYNENLRYIEDQDMWIRILEKFKIGIINKQLINYRIHDNQGSSYYSSKERGEISVELRHIREYILKNNIKLNKIIQIELRKRFAKDYNKLIRNALYNQDSKKIKELITLSKAEYKFIFPTKNWFWQSSDKFIVSKFLTYVTNNN